MEVWGRVLSSVHLIVIDDRASRRIPNPKANFVDVADTGGFAVDGRYLKGLTATAVDYCQPSNLGLDLAEGFLVMA
jgi:hypothetical protein